MALSIPLRVNASPQTLRLAVETPVAQIVIPSGLGITGACVGDLIKVSSVDANGVPTAWEAYQEKGYELIERLYIAYKPVDVRPDDWATNWSDYYYISGYEGATAVYSRVPGESAPDYTAFVSANARIYNVVSSITGYPVWRRSVEPDGTPYAFKKLALAPHIASLPAAGMRFSINQGGSTSTLSNSAISKCVSTYEVDGMLLMVHTRNQYPGNDPNDHRYGIDMIVTNGNPISAIGIGKGSDFAVTGEDYLDIYGVRA